jgi:aminomethyltransferase
MVTNDVEKLTPGQGCYAGHLNAQGKLVAQMTILATDDSLLLLVERVATANLASVFDKLIIMEDVQVQDVSEQYDIVELIGLQSRALIETSTGHSPPGSLYEHTMTSLGRVIRSDLGFQIVVPRESSANVLQTLVGGGAVEIQREMWDVLRAESGLPVYGVDIDETTTLPELGSRGISYDKGCYIGQEVVARIKYIGHVNRHFVGFVCEGVDIPEVRAAVVSNGKEVGYITTAVFSSRLEKPVALGFVNRAAATPDTAVTLVGKQRAVAARVASLPLVVTPDGD